MGLRNTPAFKAFAPAYHLCRRSRHVTMATASAADWLKQVKFNVEGFLMCLCCTAPLHCLKRHARISDNKFPSYSSAG